jgi:hypothetical protein
MQFKYTNVYALFRKIHDSTRKELIQNVADKLKAIPNKPKGPEADARM